MKRSISIPLVKLRPQRTCVICRQVKTKRELIRLVRIADGNVEIDVSGKIDGRGAYLCRMRKCWETALKSSRLEHSLKTILDQSRREQLMQAAETLFST
ncbi:MAG: YlxR family protein [Dehalococcoidales bacterium]|nr:YlxR family protein [Dehalococcoidales bacterium]